MVVLTARTDAASSVFFMYLRVALPKRSVHLQKQVSSFSLPLFLSLLPSQYHVNARCRPLDSGCIYIYIAYAPPHQCISASPSVHLLHSSNVDHRSALFLFPASLFNTARFARRLVVFVCLSATLFAIMIDGLRSTLCFLLSFSLHCLHCIFTNYVNEASTK